MLFHSATFVLGFLPIVWLAYFALQRVRAPQVALGFLVLASFVFYGWFVPHYAGLLALSVVFNAAVGARLARTGAGASLPAAGGAPATARRALVACGITANLALLGYFKYAGFLVDTAAALLGHTPVALAIVLPIGISFFTFQNIAYLVDAYRGNAPVYRWLEYALFCSFFPQLIAGPIVHHDEMMPQFQSELARRPRLSNVVRGTEIFIVGLFKKVVVADQLAAFADPTFAAAANGQTLSFASAWIGTLAFSLQIYFDFSGYTDMAIGIAKTFGIDLPRNFASPYKATSIIEFWRTWHMTLSRFLRDYLYFPLGGNRRGPARRYLNLFATMAIGGLWHGAAWTFVAWGALHGGLLIANHGFRALRARMLPRPSPPFARVASWVVTSLCVSLCWIFFRAESFPAALAMLQGVSGWNGLARSLAFSDLYAFAWLTAGWLAVWFLPNTEELLSRDADATVFPVYGARPIGLWPSAVALAVMVFAIVGSALDEGAQQFIYFQF